MKLRHFFLAALLLVSGVSMAQDKKGSSSKGSKSTPSASNDPNLVSNGNFDNADVRSLKTIGQLVELGKPWMTPNPTSADLFGQGTKGTKAGAPTNDYGVQEPASAPAYAGFRAYTKDPKKNRTYLQTKLTKKMTKDQLYCVKMQISLADLSKFAVNNVGIFISDKKISSGEDLALNFTPQITALNNAPVKEMDKWVTVCGTFISNGTEEYIVIGGFGPEDKMKVEKMKKPSGINGTVMNDAYYYVDNIEIIAIEAKSQCQCGPNTSLQPELIYSRSEAGANNLKPKEKLAAANIYYATLSAEVPTIYQEELKALTNILLADPSIKIELVGHSDLDEMAEAKLEPKYATLALQRAEGIKAHLMEAGIGESRITVTSKNADEPVNTTDSSTGKAQNRRVQFKVR